MDLIGNVVGNLRGGDYVSLGVVGLYCDCVGCFMMYKVRIVPQDIGNGF